MQPGDKLAHYEIKAPLGKGGMGEVFLATDSKLGSDVALKDEALLWLDRAIDRGMINFPFLSQHDRYLDTLRGDPRFSQVMEKARREWERFEV